MSAPPGCFISDFGVTAESRGRRTELTTNPTFNTNIFRKKKKKDSSGSREPSASGALPAKRTEGRPESQALLLEPSQSPEPPEEERPETALGHRGRNQRRSSISSFNDISPVVPRKESIFRRSKSASTAKMLPEASRKENNAATRPSTATRESSNTVSSVKPAGQSNVATAPQPVVYGPPLPPAFDLVQAAATPHSRVQETLSRRIEWFHIYEEAHLFARRQTSKRPAMAKVAPSEHARLAKRAQIYFMLGNSLSGALDPHTKNIANPNAVEYMRSFNLLMSEFENYANAHPVDGSSVGAMSRVRGIPRMFSRPSGTGVGKGRRGSGMEGLSISTNVEETPAAAAFGSFAAGENASSSESYQYFLITHFPFEIDYYETTLGTVTCLKDAYEELLGMVDVLDPAGEELFKKLDNKMVKAFMTPMGKDLEIIQKHISTHSVLDSLSKATMSNMG